MSLAARDITVGYDKKVISEHLDLVVPDGRFTAIIGPNACGKSTLLRALARLLRPGAGEVLLDGRDIHSRPAREVARRLGLLPQSSIAPDGITAAELVARGRFPHQRLIRQWSATDEAAVLAAMAATGVTELSGELVDTLSGGQRQRVWVAMVLAQQTPIVLLDEPTTFLDIAHQIELLELCVRLNREQGTTMVAVLHDLNQAARYADHLVVMKAGAIVAQGDPREVLTAGLVEDVFALGCRIIEDPETGTPLVIPRSKVSQRIG
ncbi:ABC transporter ATP-binding protein [Actinoplanes sp. NPDC049599]|uniref:ABC transporter ATP-binding protein n=1 Tax=Actinoplanes sp. NPDC049599 TaxID=3363903 RepID=UPI0037A4BC16